MPKVKAWMCPHTKKLFHIDDEESYRECVRIEEEKIVKAANNVIFKKGYDQWFRDKRADIKTIEGIRRFLIDEWETIYKRHNWPHEHDLGDEDTSPFILLDVEFVSMRFSETTRNTHAAPRGEKTQWGGDSKYADGTLVPRGRPGVSGTIKLTYNRNHCGFKTGLLGGVGVHTGSGGFRGSSKGEYRLQYDVVIFLNDWEGIKEVVRDLRFVWEKNAVIQKLKGVTVPDFNPIRELV